MRLRQVALVAKELDPIRSVIFELLGLTQDFADPIVRQFGLRNSVVPIGDTFLEIVSPVEEDTTAGRLLDRRSGNGGYMILLQVDDLSREISRIQDLEVRIVAELEIPESKAIHLHPKDIGGSITSLDQVTPPESWIWPERRNKFISNLFCVLHHLFPHEPVGREQESTESAGGGVQRSAIIKHQS